MSEAKNEVWKNRLKRYIPIAIGVAGLIVAAYYKNQARRFSEIDKDSDWETIPVPRSMTDNLDDGHTLHYRRLRRNGREHYSQCSTTAKSIGFDPEMDKRFDEERKSEN